MADEKGQTLIEFTVLVPLVAAVLIGTAGLLRTTYRRTECARLVFEGVRMEVEGRVARSLRAAGGVIHRFENGVEGRLKCGIHSELLFLPKIDRRKAGASAFRSSF